MSEDLRANKPSWLFTSTYRRSEPEPDPVEPSSPPVPFQASNGPGRAFRAWLDERPDDERADWDALLQHATTRPKSRRSWVRWARRANTRSAAEAVAPHLDDDALDALIAFAATRRAQNEAIAGALLLALAPHADERFGTAVGALLERSYVKVRDSGPRSREVGAACIYSLALAGPMAGLALLRYVQVATYAVVRKTAEMALSDTRPDGWSLADATLDAFAHRGTREELVAWMQRAYQARLGHPTLQAPIRPDVFASAVATPTARPVLEGLVWTVDGGAAHWSDGRFVRLDGTPVSTTEPVKLWEPAGAAAEAWMSALAHAQPFVQLTVDSRAKVDPSRFGPTQMLAAIHTDPQDLAVRALYADALQQQSDPQGEFIALQLADGAPTKREKALLKQYGRQWLGPLDRWLMARPLTYRNGFLYACQRVKSRYDVRPWQGTEWKTVEVMYLSGCAPPNRDLLTGARELYGVNPFFFRETWEGVTAVGLQQHDWQRVNVTPRTLETLGRIFPDLALLDLTQAGVTPASFEELVLPFCAENGVDTVRIQTDRPEDWVALGSRTGAPTVVLTRVPRANDATRGAKGWEWAVSVEGIRLTRGSRADLEVLQGQADRWPHDHRHVTLVTTRKTEPAEAVLVELGFTVTVERPAG